MASAKFSAPDDIELALLMPGYKVDGMLGYGSTSVVKKGINEMTGQLVAIKFISLKNELADVAVDREVTAMLQVEQHPNVIQLYDVVYSPSHACLVLEYASRGDFFEYVFEKTKLSEKDARPFFRQLISGVKYCHENMVAHLDLKLENLLLDDNLNLKLSDFGLSALMNDSHLLSQSCGSPHYAAPEVLAEKPYHGTPVDVWSSGVTLYAMLCGGYPFEDEDPAMLKQKIQRGRFEFPGDLSTDVQDLIAGMLKVNPERRFTIPEICQHPWFQD